MPKPSESKFSRPLYDLRAPERERLRLHWPTIYAEEIQPRLETHDFHIPIRFYSSFLRVVVQAGFFLIRHKLTDSEYIVRVVKDKPNPHRNPLAREYPRHYASRSQKARGEKAITPHNKWVKMTDALFRGETLTLSRPNLTLLKSRLKQHKPSPPFPPYELDITRKGNDRVVKLIFVKKQ